MSVREGEPGYTWSSLSEVLKSLLQSMRKPPLRLDNQKGPGQVTVYCLFGVLCRFQHCTGHITMGRWKGRGNQCIQFVRLLYCKLPTNGKQLPAFPLEAVPGIEPRPQRWEARVLPLCHHGPWLVTVLLDYNHTGLYHMKSLVYQAEGAT